MRTMTVRALPGARETTRRLIALTALFAIVCGALLALSATDAHGSAMSVPLALVREQAEAKLTASDEEGEARLGYSVALSADGSTALVGGPMDGTYGAVWVFVREGGEWRQQGGKLQGGERSGPVESCAGEAGEEEECNFGRSVSLSADGNTAIVGNPRESRAEPATEPGGPSTLRRNVGAAWVYTRSGSTWSLAARLTGGEEGGEGRFGRSVALSADGHTALIGGPSDRGGNGSVWAFTRSGEGWTQQGPKVIPGDGGGEHFFGQSVALSGDGHTAIVGEPGANGYAGAAWVLSVAEGAWVQHGVQLTALGESGAGRFGSSVALSGDASTALVGGRLDGEGAGAAWVFAGAGGSWAQQGGKLTGGEGAQGFGFSVALSEHGDVALLGSPHEGTAGSSARRYERSGEAWGTAEELEPGVSQIGHHERFGVSVALSADGSTALVGGPNDNEHRGAAYVFGQAPEVIGVTPDQGPRGGGTEVTISGSNFTGATAVRFGSADALSFTVVSAEEIVARTPPGEGSVDVEVSSPFGTSLPGAKFRYITHGGGVPVGSGPSIGTGSGGAVTGSAPVTVGSVGVLPFVSSSGTCRVALLSRKITVRSHGRAAFRLRVTGAGRCAGTLRLRVTRRISHKRLQIETIGTAVFSISAAHSAVVTVKLNRAGLNALKRHHWRLAASLLLVRKAPTPALAQTASVRLAPPAKRPRRT